MAYATSTYATTLHGAAYLAAACDRDGDGTLDAAAFDEWLEVASDIIDGYLLGRYGLPLASPPRVLKKYCVDIAVYEAANTADVATKKHEKRRDQAIDWLEKVALGKIKLETSDDSTEVNQAQEASIATKSELGIVSDDRQFRRDSLKELL